MNEVFFLSHILIIVVFAFGALRLGKEALITWVVIQAILANLFVIKQTTLFGFHATCSDGYAIGSILGLNLLQERFDRQSAAKAIKICFYFMIFFALASQLHLLYLPSSFDHAHAAYLELLSPAPRLLCASLVTFFLVQQFDVHYFAFLKKRFPRLPLFARNLLSLSLSQFLDTVLFSFLGLFGQVEHLWDIIIISFLIKLIFIASTSLSLAFTFKAQKNEQI